jgi:hypothetical protein
MESTLDQALLKQGITAPPPAAPPNSVPIPSQGAPAPAPVPPTQPAPGGEQPKAPEKSDEEKAKEVLGLANLLCVWLIKTSIKTQRIGWTPQMEAYAALSEDERAMLSYVAPSAYGTLGQLDELMKKYPYLAPCCFGVGLAWIIRTKTQTIKDHVAAAIAAQGGQPAAAPAPAPAAPAAPAPAAQFSLVPPKLPAPAAPAPAAPAAPAAPPGPGSPAHGGVNVPPSKDAPMGGLQV